MSDTWAPVSFERTNGKTPLIVVCEHASKEIPPEFSELGLESQHRASHAVWDIGALPMARAISAELDAPLVFGGVSRLLYDCNRPPEAHDCIPEKSEVVNVPGNVGLDPAYRNARALLIHDPFHKAVEGLIDAQMQRLGCPIAVVTIHTFTPIYHGKPREVEFGFLFDENAELSRAACQLEEKRGVYRAALNQPYAATDGVTYTLLRHADDRGLPSTMVEVRNDLVDTHEKASCVGKHLAETIQQSVNEILPTREIAV